MAERRVLIVGAGDHGQVVAEMLQQAHELGDPQRPIGFIDDVWASSGKTFLGLPVLGSLDQMEQVAHDALIIAIGDNAARARIFTQFEARGESFANAIHPSASVAPSVRLGRGLMICAGAAITTGASIGDNVIVNSSANVDHNSKIEAHAHVSAGAVVASNNYVGVGAFIGVGACVIPGVSVGEWAIVGAGAAVVRDIPGYTTSVGVPARVIKTRPPSSPI